MTCTGLLLGRSIASGSTRWKTVGGGGAKAFMVICLFSGIDRIRGVAQLILISQVFSSYSGRFSLVAPREGLDSSQVSHFFCKGGEEPFLLTLRALPVSYVEMQEKNAFSSCAVIIAGDPG